MTLRSRQTTNQDWDANWNLVHPHRVESSWIFKRAEGVKREAWLGLTNMGALLLCRGRVSCGWAAGISRRQVQSVSLFEGQTRLQRQCWKSGFGKGSQRQTTKPKRAKSSERQPFLSYKSELRGESCTFYHELSCPQCWIWTLRNQ